jgi:hypothetical protein
MSIHQKTQEILMGLPLRLFLISSIWVLARRIALQLNSVGNEHNSASKEQLTELGITHILNLTTEIPNSFEDDESFTYMKVYVPDDPTGFLPDVIDSVFPFLDAAKEQKYGRISNPNIKEKNARALPAGSVEVGVDSTGLSPEKFGEKFEGSITGG